MNLKKLRALQQEASEFAGVWFADGRWIRTEEKIIADADTPKLAHYICMIHNTWLLLTNHILLLRRALADRKAMMATVEKEK